MARTLSATVVAVCLGFTGSNAARADEAQLWARWVEDPFQAHDTTGTVVRAGSAVGILGLDGREYTTLGGTVAAGQRWGRLTLDAEYGYFEITERGPSNVRYGVAHELGLNVRYDVLRLGSRVVGPNSMAAIYVEGRVARQRRAADPLAPDETRRAVLPGGASNQLAAGFGLLFDHRLEQPRGFPSRVGWMLGWRVIGTPSPEPSGYATCRGSECIAAPAPDRSMEVGLGETSLVLSSSLAFTW
jgi:hypothetical protein